jgi:hypothetical protein
MPDTSAIMNECDQFDNSVDGTTGHWHSLYMGWDILFAAPGSPEHDPGSKIAGKILEPMFYVRPYKKAVSCLERVAVGANDEFTRSTMDKINFVLLMRSLGILTQRRVILD